MTVKELTNKISGIYKINFPNGKIYIGRAVNIKARIREHYVKEDHTPCQSALLLYFNSFEDINFDILFMQQNSDIEELKEKEKYYIALYNSNNKDIGYNLTNGGDGADYGVNNVASKFSDKDIKDIYKRLQNNESNIDIANIYNVHPDTIGKINQGRHYFCEEFDYPIRKNSIATTNLKNGNSFDREDYLYVVYLLKSTDKSVTQISKETGISTSCIYRINTGKHFICKELQETYPLHFFNRRSLRLTEEEITSIKEDLLNPNLSIIDIARKYGTSRDTVGDINQGKRYADNRKYPIRTFYPKRGSKKPVSTILESEE